MSGYENHYDIQLLDDLHNYFPDILYAPQRFTNVGDLLAYIRERVRDRFDLFSAGQRDFNDRNLNTIHPSTPRAVNTPPPPARSYTTRTPPVTIRPTPNAPPRTIRTSHSLLTELLIPRTTGDLEIENTLFGLISGLGGLQMPQQMPTMESVIVRPTQEQINENTTIEILDTADEQCAICQDGMTPGTEIRSLDVCAHRFHITCIDTWFTRDVHCPICRHDVREPSADST